MKEKKKNQEVSSLTRIWGPEIALGINLHTEAISVWSMNIYIFLILADIW